MHFLYKASDKKLLSIRNQISVDFAIPELLKNGFEQSPFSTAWFGKNNIGGYTYELCRLDKDLEILNIHISKGDEWIKFFLNVISPQPKLADLGQLNVQDELKYGLPPNSFTEMRLRCDEQKVPPIFQMLFGKEYKLGSYYSEKGLNKRVRQLSGLIQTDMNNINYFIKRWYEIHGSPLKTTWEGISI